MTSPPIYGSGPVSDAYFSQLAQFEAERDRFYQNFMNQTNVAGQAAGMQPMTGQVPFNGQTAMQQGASTIPPEPVWEDADLLGAARFWGIPEEIARQMPREVLLAELQKYRSQTRPDDETAMQRLQSAGIAMASMPAMAALGIGEALVGGLGNLPFVGGALKKMKPIHEANMWLRELEEGVRASNPEDLRYALNTAEIAGNLGGLWYPGAGAWALSGKVIGGLFKGSPILRASLQGTAAAGLLEGGSEHPMMAMAAGGVLGGGATAAMPYLAAGASKIAKKFVSPQVFQQQGPQLLDEIVEQTDLSPVVAAAMRGDESAIAMMQEIQQSGRVPRASVRSWQDRAGETLGPIAEQSKRLERQIFPSGYPFRGMRAADAEAAAIQLNKAGTIIESPALPQAVKSTLPDEVTVAFAAQASNPGGTNLVEGILNPADFAALGPNVAFASRGGRLAALVSDVPVSPRMVAEFEKHGVYSGQRVLTSGGNEAEILAIRGNEAVLKYPYSLVEFTRPISELSPQLQSPGIHAVPELWNEFNAFADGLTTETQAAMGGQLNPEQLYTIKTNSIQQWMDDFLDQIGVGTLGDRARIKGYFNKKWVESFYPVAPVETAQNLAGQAEMQAAIASHPLTALGRVDDLAATKGFTAIPDGQGGWILKDNGFGTQSEPMAVRFESLDAAESFLKKMNRELPDISPNSSVPGELAGVLTREPPPEINVNAKFEGQVSKAISKMANGNDGIPPIDPPEIAQAQAEGNFGKLNNLWKDGFMRWEPARRVFSKISQQVRDVAGDDFGVAKIYDEIGVKLNQHHTAMSPSMNELAEIFKGVTTKRMISGEFIDVWSVPDSNLRLSMAKQMGWDNKDVAALVNFDQLLNKIHGVDVAADDLRGMITYMRQQRSQGQNPWAGYTATGTTADFYNVAKGADYNIREMDPRRMGDSYIRSVFWQRDMAETFDAAKQQAASLKQSEELAPVGKFIDNWLDVVKDGYRPEDDIALDGIHALGRAVLGKSFSRQQARELVSFGLNTTHASFLGYRVHVMARDALQLFFALPRAGGELAEVITKFTASPKFRNEVWQEVFAEGAASATMPTRAAPGALAGELEAAGAGLPAEGMSRRMQAVGWFTSTIRDVLPDFVKGSSENVLKPMYLYGKQGQMMRTLVYKAGQIKAERALTNFRKTLDLDGLMGESGARTFDKAWQEEFKRLVATGDDSKAASFLGRQLADATQFKYGVAENPAVSRTVIGRVFMQMGSYQTQYLQYLRESLTNGTVGDKTKLLLTAGTVSAGLEAASRETGWNFRYMNPYAIGFFGGPWVQSTGALLAAGQAVQRMAYGGEVDPFNEQRANAGVRAAGQMATALNPLNGLYRTATGLGSALNDSPTPGMAVGRLMITGEQGALPDILNSIGIGEMVPESNPMRMMQMQLPYTPPMQPAYPAGMPYSPPGSNIGSGYVPVPAVVPLPGGMAAGLRPNQFQQFMPSAPLNGVDPTQVRPPEGDYYDPNNPGSGGMF